MGWLGWRWRIRSGFSAASASRSPTQKGTPSFSHSSWLAPWWSGCAWVRAWALTLWPRSCLRILLARVPGPGVDQDVLDADRR